MKVLKIENNVKDMIEYKVNEMICEVEDGTIKEIIFVTNEDSEILKKVHVKYHKVNTKDGKNVTRSFMGKTISSKHMNIYKQILKGNENIR